MGDFGKTEEDREAHKLEPLNEEDEEDFEWLATCVCSFVATAVRGPS